MMKLICVNKCSIFFNLLGKKGAKCYLVLHIADFIGASCF